MMSALRVLFEDNHCLAVLKPARLLVAPDATGDTSLLDQARLYLKVKHAKPGNVFVGLVHRLDRPASGVVLFARTSKAAARLSEQFRAGTIGKTYWAVVDGAPPADQGHLHDWILKDHEQNQVRRVDASCPEARECRLSFRVRQRRGPRTCLEIDLETGRSHQIRVQLAAAGWPIHGDVKYGAPTAWSGAIALHARELTFTHPTQRDHRITVEAPLPRSWNGLWTD